jgi:hypothetical protein
MTAFRLVQDGVVTARTPTTFFEDEWRCPVYVEVCNCLCTHSSGPLLLQHELFVLGGLPRSARFI